MGQKYHAKPTIIDGIRFASKAESKQYSILKFLQNDGQIKDLKLQPGFKLYVNGQLICTYVADFQYVDLRTGLTVIEDVKGVPTPVYKVKKKLMKAILGIEIKEVKGG